MEFFLQPLTYAFMQRGLLAGTMVGILCAVMGTYVVLRGMAFLGDALAHAIMPGVAIAYLLGGNLLIGALVAAAIANRRRPDWHKRLMLLTIACMLPDALGRLPIGFMIHATEVELNLRIMIGLDLFILICVGLDTFRHRRLHPAFGWGATLFLAAFHVALYFTQKPAWIAFSESFLS